MNDSDIDLEEQSAYKDVPEFDEINELLSNQLLRINNSMDHLGKNLDMLSVKVDDGRGLEGTDKYQTTCMTLANRLMGLFKEISTYSKRMNAIDESMLNKSQRFVRAKLNASLKESVDEFKAQQDRLSTLDRKMNLLMDGSVADSSAATEASDSQQQEQRQVVIQYEPVNAEEVEYQRNLAEERERDIEQISHGVTELNEIFQDLSNMVVTQGELVDNIESNIYSTLEHAQGASKQLRRADRYQRNQRKLCFWLLMIVCVIMVFVILIIFA